MTEAREPLSRDRVVARALEIADEHGLDALSMRTLGESLGVVPMALYKHVHNKEELLDAMVDAVVAEITPAPPTGEWKADARARIMAARSVMACHPWAWQALETRQVPSPILLTHMDATIAILRSGGLSVDLTHHVMHTLGSRVWGFSQEVLASAPPPTDPEQRAAAAAMLAEHWPHVLESAASARHDDGSVVGPGCDDDAEFAFAVDLMLDGAQRLHDEGWTSPTPPLGLH